MANGNRPFQTDHGAEECSNHQWAMQAGCLGSGSGDFPAEPGKAGENTAQQREHAKKQQRQPTGGFEIAHCWSADGSFQPRRKRHFSLIMLGFQGGSQTMRISGWHSSGKMRSSSA